VDGNEIALRDHLLAFHAQIRKGAAKSSDLLAVDGVRDQVLDAGGASAAEHLAQVALND
jgi:hypothetical protein